MAKVCLCSKTIESNQSIKSLFHIIIFFRQNNKAYPISMQVKIIIQSCVFIIVFNEDRVLKLETKLKLLSNHVLIKLDHVLVVFD